MGRNPKFRTPEEIDALLADFYQSELSRKDFAKENNIALATFGRYLTIEKQKQLKSATSGETTNAFIEISAVKKKNTTTEKISVKKQEETNLEINLTMKQLSVSLKGNISAIFLATLLKEVGGV
ncbi:MAG: hypothetical protein R3Y24_09120 [Eubacteriales bacterium]